MEGRASSSSSDKNLPTVTTPISKYLANLERQKSHYVYPFADSPRRGDEFVLPTPRLKPGIGGSGGMYSQSNRQIATKLNLDDSFSLADASMLHLSPQLQAGCRSVKRKRLTAYGMFGDEDEVDLEEIQKKNSELEKLLRQTQAELINVRAAQTKLEHLNNEMKLANQERIIHFDKVESEEQIKSKNAVEKALILEKQVEKLEKSKQEIQETAEQQRNAFALRLTSKDERIVTLQNENFDLKQKLTQESIKSEDSRRKLQAELTETEQGAEKWIMDSQVLKDQLTLLQTQLSTCQDELKVFKMDACKYQEVKDKYNIALSSSQTSEARTLELNEMVKKYENLYIREQHANNNLGQVMKKLQDENSILRSTIREEMILQEKITNLESKVSFMTKELKEKGACDAERNVLKEEVKMWKEISSKIDTSCLTPLSLEKAIRQLQNMLFEFRHENSDLKRNYENSSRIVSTLQTESISLREQLKHLKDDKEKLTGDVKTMSRRLILIVKDRDGLIELKQSYEKEFEGLISEPLQKRVTELQEIVLEYETMLKDDALSKRPCAECEKRITLVQSLQSKLDETIREKEVLSLTLANQTVNPDDETSGVKIVAFGNNPSMLTVEARLKECLAENETLKEKLRKYEEDTLVGVTDEAVLEEKKKLEDQLRVLERKHEILTQAYDYETVQLTQACSKLFGFYVTLVREPQNQIRLQSVYSSTPDHVFIFQEAENSDDMMLLETPILDHFRDDIQKFLIGEGSIPGFLASVTITYTQGLGQQTSNFSETDADDQNVTVMAALQGTQHGARTSSNTSGIGTSEVQIEVEGQESSSEEEEDEEEEEERSEESEQDLNPEEDYVDEEESEGDEEPEDQGNDSDDSDIVMID